MTLLEFLNALKSGKCDENGWDKVILTINKQRLNRKILDGVYIGWAKLNEKDKLLATKSLIESK